jgi:hypothetical protein
MQLAVPQPRRHKVLMAFRYWNAWDVIFFETDRMRTALPRRARFNSDEALIDFAQRGGGIPPMEAWTVVFRENRPLRITVLFSWSRLA